MNADTAPTLNKLVRSVMSVFLLLLSMGCSRNALRPISSPMPTSLDCIRPLELGQLGVGGADISGSGQMLAIYYLSAPGGLGDVAVVDLATTQSISQRVRVDDLKSSTARVHDLVWSGMPTELLYLDGKSVNAVNLDTARINAVAPCEGCAAIATSPTNITATLRVADGFARIIVEGSAGNQIVVTDTHLTSGSISISPNGRWLTYLVIVIDSDSGQATYQTRVYDLSTQAVHTTTAANYLRPSWLADDVLVAPDPLMPRLWAIDLISGKSREIADFSAQKLPMARITGVLMRPGGRYWLLQSYHEIEVPRDLWVVDALCLKQK